MDVRVPQPLADATMKAEHRLNLVIVIGSCQKNLSSVNGLRSGPSTSDRTLQEHIVRFAPRQRRLLIRGRDAVPLRPSPPRPVGGRERDRFGRIFVWLAGRKQGDRSQ